MKDVTLVNTVISFTPSFLGGGWETSLIPRFDKKDFVYPKYTISFDWLKKIFLKIHYSRKKEAAT